MKAYQVSADRAEPVTVIAASSFDAVIAQLDENHLGRIDACPKQELSDYNSNKFKRAHQLERQRDFNRGEV